MNINEVIEVQRDANSVWELFQDVPELARCLPGAEITGQDEDGTYAGNVSAKLGPMKMTFEGQATVELDPAARSGTVSGKGVDRAGGSIGRVELSYRIEPTDSGTRVTIDANLLLSGAAAQFGRTGLLQEISKQLIGEFVQCVEAKLASESPEEASKVSAGEVRGFSLFVSSLSSSLVRFFKRLFQVFP